MKRRRVLAATGASLVPATGCLDIAGGDKRSDTCPEGARLSLQPVTVPHVSNEWSTNVESLPYASRTAVTDALATNDGESKRRGYYPRMPAESFVFTESMDYYRVEATESDAVETTGYRYSVDVAADGPSGSAADASHTFAALPAHDRATLRSAAGNQRLLHAPHYSFSVVFAHERETRRDHSAFVPARETHALQWNDALVRVDFEERRTVEIATTVISTELVAESEEAFFQYVSEEYGGLLDSLTNEQRDVVTRARNGTHTECGPTSEAFRDLAERLEGDGRGRNRLARYDGEWYFVHLSRGESAPADVD